MHNRPVRRIPLILALLLTGFAPAGQAADPLCPATAAVPLPLPGTQAALASGRDLVILALGSSSTEGSGASGPDRTYPARLEATLRAALPGIAVRVVNRGRGGEDAAEMLARLDREVAAAHPVLVIWQAGANALLNGMPPGRFRALMEAGIARLRGAGVEVVLMDNQRAPRLLAAPSHAAFEALMPALAAATGAPLFSRAALMRGWEAAGAPAAGFIGEDGLHHNDRGYACLAAALAEALLPDLRAAAGLARVAAGPR